MKRSRVFFASLFILVTTVLIFHSRGTERQERLPNVLLLKQVQSLGDLHTAKFTYQDIFDYQTSVEPARWVDYVPGGESLVQSATRNRALMSAVGSVEAGVDLRRANVEGNVVHLPPPEVYEPTVKAWARNVQRGLFWKDDNIGLKAADLAKERLTMAAIQQGIRQKAATEAVQRVQRLLQQTGRENVSVVCDL